VFQQWACKQASKAGPVQFSQASVLRKRRPRRHCCCPIIQRVTLAANCRPLNA
jgi:hypothetical protein